MTPKTTLNAKNLETLGAARLAELLIEISTGSAAAKRRLRLELAGNRGINEVAHEVRKRLASIARSKIFINWRRVKAVRTDLDTQRRTIAEVIAGDDPKEAFELIWQFLSLASPVMERASDSSASLIDVFHEACADTGNIAKLANLDAGDLSEKIVKALQLNDNGQFDPLIEAMSPVLGQTGLENLKAKVVTWRDEPGDRRERLAAQTALQQIADIEGDVDAYVAELLPEARSSTAAATEIAKRLIRAGRSHDALAALEEVDSRNHQGKESEAILDWQLVRLDVLEALGRKEESQADRWTWFEHSLSVDHLGAFLRRLPDFDDVEVEEKAFRFAGTFPKVERALAFFLAWPAHVQAARMIVDRGQEFDGNDYELLSGAAESLAAKYPLAATILWRAMIDFTLDRARASRYKHAARHLAECASAASRISEFDGSQANSMSGIETHQAYVTRLRQRHGMKQGFWKRVQP